MGAKRIAVAVTTAVCTVAIMREREREEGLLLIISPLQPFRFINMNLLTESSY